MATLGDYIHYNYSNYEKYGTGRKKGDPDRKILETEKNKMIERAKRGKSVKNLKKLESALNGMIYPKTEEDKDSHNRMKNYLMLSMTDMCTKWVMQWEGLGIQGATRKADSYKFGEVQGYSKSNIDALLNQLREVRIALSSAQITGEFVRKIDSLIDLVARAQANAETYLKGRGGDMVRYAKIADPVQREDYLNVIKAINGALSTMATAAANDTIGLAFEHAIALMDDSLTDTVAGTGYEIVRDVLSTGTKSDTVDLGQLDKFLKQTNESLVTTSLDAEVKIDIKGNPSSSAGTIYKTDVQLTYNGEKYNISAKNYTLKDPRVTLVHGLSPLTGLLRNIETESVNHALNQIFAHGVPQDVSDNAHRQIKTILAIEALTGMSQRHGGSDIIVINNRSKRRVMVARVEDVVKDADRFLEMCSFSGYDFDKPGAEDIYNRWVDAKEHGDDVQLKIRQDLLLSKFHKAKIKIRYNTNNLPDVEGLN